ncbi:hypothetical protein FOXB_17138 [Fusarium oxysporum f. sp. conglutinans Fo5176]|uniref:Uncharacterized protein n=1 Tax=Fusarium oxysporum (strain Fo5176) TaxID=660025 RepID=F9GEQ4_FUSOF|nr:hypothetical protein FOXB_17138 [Fusarium oxysporum f. sp. conglutinans Fo5176]
MSGSNLYCSLNCSLRN